MTRHIIAFLLPIICVLLIIAEVHASCRGRCGFFDRSRSCHCNSACSIFGDCCSDYHSLCNGGATRQSISSRDISRLARDIWVADVNRVPGWQYAISRQTRLRHIYRKRDRSPQRFFTSLEPSSLDGTTVTPFRALLNNYARATGVQERTSSIEDQEIETFLTAVLNTNVMRLTYNFLFHKGYFTTQIAFKNYLKYIWFGLYSRSGGTLDSSGFEHIFVGEVKNGAVMGFRNWIQFAIQETTGNLNYYGYTRTSQPNQVLVQFNWYGQVKTLSSFMVGVSPEFELALFTVCFIAQPDNRCSFALNGHQVTIKTWTLDHKMGAAYFHVH